MRGCCSQSQCQRGRGGVQRMPGIAALQSIPRGTQQQIANPLQAQDPMEAVCKKTCSPQMRTSTPTPRDWGYKPTCVPACLCIMCMFMWVNVHLCRPQCDVCVCVSVVVRACICLGVFVWVFAWVYFLWGEGVCVLVLCVCVCCACLLVYVCLGVST